MAVFPDRIVFKNSSDSDATIEAAIEAGGTDEITQGEIVLGISPAQVKFFTKAGDGSIVSLGGTGTGAQYIDDLLDVDTSTVAPTDGQLLFYDNANSMWKPGFTPRSTVTHTTASIADGISEDATFTTGSTSGQFISVTVDRAAWVTLYTSTAARSADSGRSETTDPTPGSGVVLEVITSGADTIEVTPSAGFSNHEATPVAEIYAKIVNKSGASSTVQVDIDILNQ